MTPVPRLRVRALDRHRHRFTTTCAETADIPRTHLDTFWTAVADLLLRDAGAWFPRVELERARRTHPRARSCPARTACSTGCAPPPPAAPRPGSGAWPSATPAAPPATPAGELPVLPGVTAALLLDHAARTGVPVRPVRRRLSALAGREVWVTNALHGLRPVTAWTGITLPTAVPLRAPAWQSWLDTLSTPLP